MKKQTYEKMTEGIKSRPILCMTVIWTNRLISILCYGAYVALIALLFIKKEPDVIRALMVPGISFALVSLFRYWYNAPRPYEVFGVDSVVFKETKGKSFPSRHIFSIFVITVTLYYFHMGFGTALGICGLALAVLRILGGVHYPRDVVVGASLGILCGITGFYLI